jgi:hypothetical protein
MKKYLFILMMFISPWLWGANYLLSWSAPNIQPIAYYEVKYSTNLPTWMVYTNTTKTNLIISTVNKMMYFTVNACQTTIKTNNWVELEWDISIGAAGYRIAYGTNSLKYNTTTNVGNVLRARVLGLKNQNTYFFGCKAYNTFDIESPFSNEVVFEVPSLVTNRVGVRVKITKL